MSAEAVIGVAGLQALVSTGTTTAPSGGPARAIGPPEASPSSFTDVLTRSIGEVNARLVDSHVDLQRLASGDVENLHQVLIGLEESRLSFQLMLQVRNRLLESYQELMRMPV